MDVVCRELRLCASWSGKRGAAKKPGRMKLRVGLVGLGTAWEKRHRSALRSMSDRFEVRAICEQVAHRAEHAAREFQADTIDGYHALARREDIDAIMMLSSEWYGMLPIHAACDAGKAVYCAAAMDLKADEATAVKRRVEDAGIAFMVEFPRRLAPATLRLKELIATQLGKPRLLFCHVRLPNAQNKKHRSSQGSQRCGTSSDNFVMRELIELVDWCRYVVGRSPTSVVSNGRPSGPQKGGYRMMSVDFGDGISPSMPNMASSVDQSPEGDHEEAPLAQISCGDYLPEHWLEATSYRLPTGLQVACENGVAFVDLPSTLVWFNEAGRHVESLESESPVGEQLLGQFHRAVTSLLRSTDDLDKAHSALKTVLAAETSRVEGRRVRL